jgi:hypothetical protein
MQKINAKIGINLDASVLFFIFGEILTNPNLILMIVQAVHVEVAVGVLQI